jgi:hypothetical protein
VSTGRCTRCCPASPCDPRYRRPQRRAAARLAERGVAPRARCRGPPRPAAHARGRDRCRILRDLRAGGRLRGDPRRRRSHRRRLGRAVRRTARLRARRRSPRRSRRSPSATDDRPDDRRPRGVPAGGSRARSSISRAPSRSGPSSAASIPGSNAGCGRSGRLEPAERVRLRRPRSSRDARTWGPG